MCVDTYSLNCIQFPLWTLIDSFIWNEIVHGISCDVCRWYHQYDAYSTPTRWSLVMLSFLPGSVGVACSTILSVSFERMGCEPVLNLAAPPDEAVSIICTIVDKTILYFMGKADVCELYYWLASVSVGHPVGALAIICCWVLLTWLTYAYVMICQDDVAPGEFLLVQCACQLFFGLGTSTHVCPWSITDRYIIKRHVSHAWYWFWTIKTLVEAVVLWWLYSNSRGHSSSIDHC